MVQGNAIVRGWLLLEWMRGESCYVTNVIGLSKHWDINLSGLVEVPARRQIVCNLMFTILISCMPTILDGIRLPVLSEEIRNWMEGTSLGWSNYRALT